MDTSPVVPATPGTAAAPASLPIAATPNPHYQRLGGHETIVQLVDAFYRAMDRLPEAATIRAMHAPDLSHTKAVLVAYLSEWTGGPKLYAPLRGAPMLRRRHQPFDIDASARDAWMLCMRTAMAEVVADTGLRDELDAAFYKIADFIRNTEHGGSTRPHPGRPREVAPDLPAAPHSSTA
ncbi:MAG: group II truncated hemoglobin [Leptothrix sp. (in: b-proteobacteria)]